MLHFNFKKTALLTISLLMHPAYTLTTLYAPVENGIKKISNTLDEFFSQENNDSYLKHIAAIKAIAQELITVLKDLSAADNSKYTRKIYELGMLVKIKLENVITVLENNKDKGPIFAIKVGLEIKNACNVAELFTTVKKELEALLETAKKEKNIPMAKEIHSLLQTLSKVDKIWQDEKHQEFALIDGLRHRMKQK